MPHTCQNPRCRGPMPHGSDWRARYCSLKCKQQAAYHRRAQREKRHLPPAAPTIALTQQELDEAAQRLLTQERNLAPEPAPHFTEPPRETSEDFVKSFMRGDKNDKSSENSK